ncbi:grasp-with-spasm system ATP-grasp peptide maturase [Belliella pelovolcani]|uniref:ATP-GRASP peptide maturase, grasp-with-spasm system n=1 Tax=Belliella pelovolcani TaxID=529505 RepID=A0A1N7Q4N4_9BACT|nr:grasp-with-spasm system ATP-grasp peptide maturase [Belliella pelovolcani]SIT17803.1 ATP-GRASP peptide maturase, grasp-with-spasm system [Belliella pelovolcani]
MIIIISHNYLDEPTNDVIEWLTYFKADFERINGDDFIDSSKVNINIQNNLVTIGTRKIYIDKINVAWYRRWNSPNFVEPIFKTINDNKLNEHQGFFISRYSKYLDHESISAYNFFFNVINKDKWIPYYKLSRGFLEKSEVLLEAKKCGLQIPETIVTNSRDELLKFIEKYKNVITKSIRDVDIVSYANYELDVYTKTIDIKTIKSLSKNFIPTLFQRQIIKEFEIRTFFIDDYFTSMAIFSQKDEKTRVDFRNYNLKKPNRFIPFNLPTNILVKIRKLVKKLELRTGSIDIIYSEIEKEYFFLEINPVGQLGMISQNCNIPLEKIIAERLIQLDRK